jgi:hypothetical protein
MDQAMLLIHMTWDELSQIFCTRGEVLAIYQDIDLAGLYWIEERRDTLHLL